MFKIANLIEQPITDVSLRAGSTLIRYRFKMQGAAGFIRSDFVCIGIDPGVTHLGFAFLVDQDVEAWEIELKNMPSDVADRMLAVYRIARQVCDMSIMSRGKLFAAGFVGVMEGAIHGGSVFGQVDLAHARAALLLSVRDWGNVNFSVINPATVRKEVLGKGNLKSQEVWPEIGPNAANALACMILAWRKAS